MKKYRYKANEVEIDNTLSLSTLNDEVKWEFPSELVNSVRYLVTRLIYKSKLPPRLALVSPLRQEGVTYISQVLSAVIAHDLRATVCLVELNWWWPDKKLASLNNGEGLASVLNQSRQLEDVYILTKQSKVTILPSGKMPPQDRPIWARSSRLKEIIDQLSDQFDHLIFDVPAILATNDAIPLASLSDSCCVVINQGVTSFENARLALDEISHLSVSGVIMNKSHVKTPSWLLKFVPQDMGPVETV